jgi:hypothetical protein
MTGLGIGWYYEGVMKYNLSGLVPKSWRVIERSEMDARLVQATILLAAIARGWRPEIKMARISPAELTLVTPEGELVLVDINDQGSHYGALQQLARSLDVVEPFWDGRVLGLLATDLALPSQFLQAAKEVGVGVIPCASEPELVVAAVGHYFMAS